MSGVQTRLQREAATARIAAEAASAAAGAPPSPPGGVVNGQGSSTDQMLAFLITQSAYQQRFAAAQLAQQTAAAAEAAAASEARLAQTRAGPAPLFSGKQRSIEAHRWLAASERWFDASHISTDDDATRIEIATSSLRDAAQAWWSTKVVDGTAARLNTWALFKVAISTQFMPLQIEVWALRERESLISAKMRNVLEYTAKFEELDQLLPNESTLSRVVAYGRGLPEAYALKCSERSFTTLAEATAAMTVLWHAKEANRHPGTSLNRTEAVMPREETEASMPASSSSLKTDRSEIDELRTQIAQLTAMMTERSTKQGDGRGGRGRGGFGRSRQPGEGSRNRERTPGLSSELARARIAAGQCIKCGQEGHFKAECTNPARLN